VYAGQSEQASTRIVKSEPRDRNQIQQVEQKRRKQLESDGSGTSRQISRIKVSKSIEIRKNGIRKIDARIFFARTVRNEKGNYKFCGGFCQISSVVRFEIE
jgi:hypothetical protein